MKEYFSAKKGSILNASGFKSILTLGMFFLLMPVFANGSVWLHERSMETKGDMKLEEGGNKELLVKSGSFPSGNLVSDLKSEDTKVYISDPDDRVFEGKLEREKIKLLAPHKGHHRVVLVNKYIENGVLHVVLAKAEVYNASGSVKDSIAKEVRGRTIDSHYDKPPIKEIPFEIVMLEPKKEHHIKCCLYSGDIASFKVYYRGVPQEGIPLRVMTQKGWNMMLATSSDGTVSFEVLRDSYVDITREKRQKEAMLVEAEYTTKETGIFNGKPYESVKYTMTFPTHFYPSPLEYSAKVPAFLTAIGVMLVFSLGAYYHRRKKRKLPGEIVFDEDK